VADDLGNFSQPVSRPRIGGLYFGQLDGELSRQPFVPGAAGDAGTVAVVLYAAMGVGAFIFVIGYVPETKGKSLEEISRQWRPQAAGIAAGQ
jgi:hypothetical protein